MRILLVDDQAHEIVSAFLELDGHEITTEANGDSAFQRYLADGPFDLVLTDIEHPGMNGVDLMHAIHEKNPKQNVQIITAWPVLRKPFTKEQLLAFVKLGQNGPDSKPPTLDDIKSNPFAYGRPPEQVLCYLSQRNFGNNAMELLRSQVFYIALKCGQTSARGLALRLYRHCLCGFALRALA